MRVGTTWWVGSPGFYSKRGTYRYTEEHVRALRSQVEGVGQELAILGNQQIATRLLCQQRLYGWYSKLEWFAPWNEDLRPCLVIDLDTFVLKSLEPILELDASGLWLIRQFLRDQGLGESGLFIAPKNCDEIWAAINSTATCNLPVGDGMFMRMFPHRFIPDVVDGIHSYKAHNLVEGPRADTRVLCFHGKPRPHEAAPWARTHWLEHVAQDLDRHPP